MEGAGFSWKQDEKALRGVGQGVSAILKAPSGAEHNEQ